MLSYILNDLFFCFKVGCGGGEVVMFIFVIGIMMYVVGGEFVFKVCKYMYIFF